MYSLKTLFLISSPCELEDYLLSTIPWKTSELLTKTNPKLKTYSALIYYGIFSLPFLTPKLTTWRLLLDQNKIGYHCLEAMMWINLFISALTLIFYEGGEARREKKSFLRSSKAREIKYLSGINGKWKKMHWFYLILLPSPKNTWIFFPSFTNTFSC